MMINEVRYYILEGGGYEEEEGGYKELGGLEGVYASKWIR